MCDSFVMLYDKTHGPYNVEEDVKLNCILEIFKLLSSSIYQM